MICGRKSYGANGEEKHTVKICKQKNKSNNVNKQESSNIDNEDKNIAAIVGEEDEKLKAESMDMDKESELRDENLPSLAPYKQLLQPEYQRTNNHKNQ